MRREKGESGSNLLQNFTEERDGDSASHDDQLKQKMKITETEKSNAEDVKQQGMETFAETTKKKFIILRANEIMAEKPWYILKIALNKKGILNNKNLN